MKPFVVDFVMSWLQWATMLAILADRLTDCQGLLLDCGLALYAVLVGWLWVNALTLSWNTRWTPWGPKQNIIELFEAQFLDYSVCFLFWDISSFCSWKFSYLQSRFHIIWPSSGSSLGVGIHQALGIQPVPTVIPRWCPSLTFPPTSLCLMPPLPK